MIGYDKSNMAKIDDSFYARKSALMLAVFLQIIQKYNLVSGHRGQLISNGLELIFVSLIKHGKFHSIRINIPFSSCRISEKICPNLCHKLLPNLKFSQL